MRVTSRAYTQGHAPSESLDHQSLHPSALPLTLLVRFTKGVAHRPTRRLLPSVQRLGSMQARSLGLAASFIRGGTSKGVFLRRDNLPKDISEWKPILLGIMGSPDPGYGRQLNGMGGGVSSLSKVCVVGAASPELREQGVEVDYTFVQVSLVLSAFLVLILHLRWASATTPSTSRATAGTSRA